MSDDSGAKSAGIPAWQRAAPPDSTSSKPEQEKPTTSPLAEDVKDEEADKRHTTEFEAKYHNPSPSSSPDVRADQIKRFLADDTLRNATYEQKVSFLESKGHSKAEIEDAMKEAPGKVSEQATPSASNQLSQTQFSWPSQPSGNNAQPPALPNRDVPPIITYPEFLVQAQKPPPLITVSRLLNTAYIAAGMGAAIYGASKYLITPMTDTLTDARHDFATHVQDQVEELNRKLREVTSSDPADANSPSAARKTLRFKDPAGDEDNASDDSSNPDPTELFHRDFGTQTSPLSENSRPPPPTSPSSSSDDGDLLHGASQTSRLSEISHHLTALTNDDTITASSNAEISTVIRVLNEYLESLAFPAFSSGNGYGYSTSYGGIDKSEKQNDEASKTKAEIRGIKGVLLSAKNFPASGGGRRAMYPPTSTATTGTG